MTETRAVALTAEGIVSEAINDANSNTDGDRTRSDVVLYSVDENPPWYLCFLLGFQHYLTAVGGLISTSVLLSGFFCMEDDALGLSQLIGTLFFVSGLCTLLQTTFGVRLPIVQGGTFSFVVPTIAIMSQEQWKCPYTTAKDAGTSNFTAIGLPEIGSDEHREMWMSRIREIQGAIMVASLFQVVIGFSGIIGLALRFIGPLSITPTITLIGLSLFDAGSSLASQQWWIALTTMCLIALFSQYLKNVTLPLPVFKDGRCQINPVPIFSLFPVLFAMILSWIICAILTITDVLPETAEWGHLARTDRSLGVLEQAPWFRFPYPGQWGVPTVSVSSVFGILAGVLASVVESVGDYYACARLSGAPPPPVHAVNRGIGVEGIACILTGAWGSGTGTTSYSENIGAIGITKVGSRLVVQVAGVVMLLLGCLGKFGALFSTIPGPVIGGMFMVTFGMVTSVGLSNLQYVNMNSSRNIFIVGVSMYFGLSLPKWLAENPAIDTGNDIVDQILNVLLETSMFVGGFIGFVLDNTIPGTDEERGIKTWRQTALSGNDDDIGSRMHIYDFPCIQHALNKITCVRYIPFCPSFLVSETALADVETGLQQLDPTSTDVNRLKNHQVGDKKKAFIDLDDEDKASLNVRAREKKQAFNGADDADVGKNHALLGDDGGKFDNCTEVDSALRQASTRL